MTAQKARITAALAEIGAAWAGSRRKYISADRECCPPGSSKTYHIHPDRSYPHVSNIIHFSSLKEIEAWIKSKRPLRRRPDAPQRGKPTLVYLPVRQKRELRRRHGSVQAAVETLIARELEN